MDPRDRDHALLECLHAAIHQLLEDVEELSHRTASIEEISKTLACPQCGHAMTPQPLVLEKRQGS